jgi:hypothetical protein
VGGFAVALLFAAASNIDGYESGWLRGGTSYRYLLRFAKASEDSCLEVGDPVRRLLPFDGNLIGNRWEFLMGICRFRMWAGQQIQWKNLTSGKDSGRGRPLYISRF